MPSYFVIYFVTVGFVSRLQIRICHTNSRVARNK